MVTKLLLSNTASSNTTSLSSVDKPLTLNPKRKPKTQKPKT